MAKSKTEDAPEPAEIEPASPEYDKPSAPKSSKGLKAWWKGLSKRTKIILSVVMSLVVLIGIVALTPLKYPVVGLVHQGQVTLIVVDDTTNLPIPDAQVGVGTVAVTTDKTGQVTLTGLKLGKTTVTINKHAYITKTAPVTIFWGPVRLGIVTIHSNGVLVKFSVTNWVSEKPVPGAKVTIGTASAVTSAAGLASVSLDPAAVVGAKAIITATGFTSTTVDINKVVAALNAATLVPSGSVYFFSNRSGGRIDLYSANLDGSGPTVILKGTGSEDTATGLLPSVTDPATMAIVSSRAGKHDNNGNLQHDLYLFNGTTQTITQIDTNVDFNNFRAWFGTNLVYIKENSDDSYVINAYDAKTKTKHTLTTLTKPTPDLNNYSYLNVNGLGDNGQNLYYSVQSSDVNQIGFYSIGLSGGSKRLDAAQVNQSFRNSKDTMILALTPQGGVTQVWKKFTFASGAFVALPGEPASQTDRGYADSPDGTHSVFVETRDGKSQLYLTDGAGNNDSAITTSGFVNQFVQWYNNQYVAYSTNQQGASTIAIVGIAGGPEKKVTDFFKGNGITYGGGYNPNYN